MNNYEHLVQGGIDALGKLLSEERCNHCTRQGTGAHDCASGQIEWLEAEFGEPVGDEKQAKRITFFDRKCKSRSVAFAHQVGNGEETYEIMPCSLIKCEECSAQAIDRMLNHE